MRLLIKILLGLIITIVLTLVTQVGGIVFLISILTFGIIDKRFNKRWSRFTVKVLSFLILYFLFVIVIIPLTSKPFGRVPLPLFETNNVRPANLITVLLNRNYV